LLCGQNRQGEIDMTYKVKIHYANTQAFSNPCLWIWYDGSTIQHDITAISSDDYGPIFEADVLRSNFHFKFKDGEGTNVQWEQMSLDRRFVPIEQEEMVLQPSEVWCTGDNAFVYHVRPREIEQQTAAEFLEQLSFREGSYISGTGGFSGLGANVLKDGQVLFGLYHPNAGRVYLMGEFNDWQRPGHSNEDPEKFIELKRYQGYFGAPNTWLGLTKKAEPGQEYKFFIQGGVPRDHKARFERYATDPYARGLGSNFRFNNSVIVDPSSYEWNDEQWQTPAPNELIIYELSVHGFTDGDPDISPQGRGRFKGITERVRKGYLEKLGVTALSLMPLAETPSIQGPSTLGYNSSLFMTVERDFGSIDDLRELVDVSHQHGLAVILDEVFNHTDNNFNPLWQLILEHPGEELANEGGVYFHGGTPWGNRVDTGKEDVQNLLIDACKLLIEEYHVDGFRFDATHTNYMHHGCLQRLAKELRGFKSDVILIAENLPNQRDLNLQGYDGYGQWSDQFHDKVKALLREGEFEHNYYDTEKMGDMFYFSKQNFAEHTNNVVNYCESHDENSVPFEVGTNPVLNQPAAKDRKGRLGLLSTMVSMGQPMIYMGQEFNVDRARNTVTVNWPENLDQHGFYNWAYRLIKLRKRYPGLKMDGYDPATDGDFEWIAAPWMDNTRGGGRKVIGWRTKPNGIAHDRMLVLLNFENNDVTLDVDMGLPGRWVKLADIDNVNDIPPFGSNGVDNPTTLESMDGNFSGFTLPSSSGFVYKWETSAVAA